MNSDKKQADTETRHKTRHKNKTRKKDTKGTALDEHGCFRNRHGPPGGVKEFLFAVVRSLLGFLRHFGQVPFGDKADRYRTVVDPGRHLIHNVAGHPI
jgi:hypothetical protein